jgi:purine-binding chemotaxis protein CheW
MVDLVKVRKKAKQKAEGKRQKAEERPQASGLGPREPAPEVVPVAAPVTSKQPPVDPPATGNRQPATRSKLERFLETAGTRRKAETTKVAATADRLELLTFYIAGELYAIDIDSVVEIITPRPVTRIPNADPSVVGILSLRGTVVTLIDVRRRLGHQSGEVVGDDVRIVVVQRQGEDVGFTVDRVVRVVKAEAGSIEPHPVVHASEHDESVRGVFRQGDALTILLDLEKLVSQD